MYCVHCGAPLDREVSECPYCGEPPTYFPDFDPRPRKRHPVFFIVLLALLIAAGFGLRACIASGSRAEDCFEISDGVLSFNPGNYTGGKVLTVPETIDGETVTAIGDYCFFECDMLTTIILPDTVTQIGEYAFSSCAALRGLDAPGGLSSIGAYTFSGCSAMEAITIPSTVTQIGDGAFDGCYNLRYIFYAGFSNVWNRMYSAYISPFTYVICMDGDYRHGP